MTQIHWAHQLSGLFTDQADWSGGTVPGAGDDAILDAAGGLAYTVTASTNRTVASIQTASTATLDIKADFLATNGTGAGANAGAIHIENGATLTLEGPVANTGVIELFGGASTTSIVIGAGGVTLSGGGPIFLNFTGGKFQQIVGATAAAVLTDVDDRISGQGVLGGGRLTIVNQAQGFIEAKGGLLVIDTGTNTIVNAGLIDAEGAPDDGGLPPGQAVISSPVDNSGILECDGVGATVTLNRAVTGSGRGVLAGGTLRFNSSFNQNVGFEAAGGVLFLAQSVNYTSLVIGFSPTGGCAFDLGDIGFVSAGEATFSGTTRSGVLTVTDGTHTARITLGGNYTGSNFIAASDGHGGTTVTAEPRALHWLNAVSGSFLTAAYWTGGLVPGSGSDAILDAPGAVDYTVTVSASRTVGSLQTAPTATLAIAAGTFTTAGGSGGGAIAGTIGGAGTLTLTGGATAFAAGARLTVAHVTVSGAATAADIATNLAYAGVWTQTAGTVSVALGDRLTFTGPGNSFTGALAGAGTVFFLGGADTLKGVTLSAAHMVINAATVTLQGVITLSDTLIATTGNLIVASSGASLTGGGSLVLTNSAANRLYGAGASARLVNVNDIIRGAGQLGAGRMILINQKGGTIDGDYSAGLTIDTGANAIGNAGLIEATAGGAVIIRSAISNTGTLAALGGNLTVNGAVTGGAGWVHISAGTADFTSAFSQNVTFGATGVLELARSRTYAGTITGFSKTGSTSLDLADIAFGASTTAAYSGTTASGVLTVSDGTHTAHIKLSGNYTTSAFTVSTDGHGGTKIVDAAQAGAEARVPGQAISAGALAHFVAVMAGHGAQGGVSVWLAPAERSAYPLALTAPRLMSFA